MRHVSDEVLALLKQWEGFVPYAYDDADKSNPKRRIMPGDQVQGTLTIGYGHTGPDVRPGNQMSEEAAEYCLRRDLSSCEEAIESLVTVPLSDNQFGALVSFVFNLGPGAFAGSTLLRRLNAGDYHAVPVELARWNKTSVNGRLVVSPGLVNRRAAEAGLWARGSYVASAYAEVQPGPRPMGAGDVVAGVAGGGSLAGSVLGALTEHGDLIDRAQAWMGSHTTIGIIAGVVAVAALGWLVWSRWRRRQG